MNTDGSTVIRLNDVPATLADLKPGLTVTAFGPMSSSGVLFATQLFATVLNGKPHGHPEHLAVRLLHVPRRTVPPAGALAGWTALNADDRLDSVPSASSATDQVFNAYFDKPPPGTAGQGFMLGSHSATATTPSRSRSRSRAARAPCSTQPGRQAAGRRFGLFQLGPNLTFQWQSPADSLWYALVNLSTGDGSGTGVVVASSVGYSSPYLAPWQSAQTNPAWSYTPPGGWNVPNGSDLSYVDSPA